MKKGSPTHKGTSKGGSGTTGGKGTAAAGGGAAATGGGAAKGEAEAEATLAAARQEATRIKAEAERAAREVRGAAETDAARLRAAAEAERREAQAYSARVRAEAESSSLGGEARRPDAASVPVDVIVKTRHALQSASEKLAAASATFDAALHAHSSAEAGLGTEREFVLEAGDSLHGLSSMAGLGSRSPSSASSASSASSVRSPVTGGAAARSIASQSAPAAASREAPPTDRERGASAMGVWFGLAAVVAVGALTAVVVRQMSALQDSVDQQREAIAHLGQIAPARAAEPAPEGKPLEAPSRAVAVAAQPSAAPSVGMAALPAVAITAAHDAPSGSPEAALSSSELASVPSLLQGRPVGDWQKKRIILAGRRALKTGHIQLADLDKLTTRYSPAYKMPPLSRDEFDALQKVHRAQKTLQDCKLLDSVDMQLGAGTRTRLGETLAGAAGCNSTKPDAIAAFNSLKKDLATAEWKSFLDDESAVRLVTSVLEQH